MPAAGGGRRPPGAGLRKPTPKPVVRKVRAATRGPVSPVSQAGAAVGRRAPAKRVGVFKKPVARKGKPVDHTPFREDRKKARARVRATARKLPANTKVKIVPDIRNPTPRQKRAVDRAVKENAKTLGVKTQTGVALPKAKRDRLTAPDVHTRRALEQIVDTTKAERKASYKAPSGEANAKIFKRSAVSKAGIGGLGHVGRQIKAVAPDSGAAVRDILDETTRPLHGIAAGTKAAIEGKNVGKAALKGLKNEDKSTFSDVLESAGVDNKYVKGVAGFALDVGLDPTTYLTLGAGVPAKVGAKGVAKQAAKDQTRGVRVGLRGHVPFTDKTVEVKTSGKTTARVGDQVKRLAGEPGQKASAKVRDALNETVSPNTTPSYRTRGQHSKIRDAERTARARIATGEKKIHRRAKAYKKAIGDEPAAPMRIVQATEKVSARRLPGNELKVADALTKDFARQLREKKKAGLGKRFEPQGPEDAQAFFPHLDRLETDPPKGLRALRQPAKGKRAVDDKVRTVRLPLHKAEDTRGPGRYELRPEIAYAHASVKSNRAVALSDMWKKVAATGRPLTKNAKRTENELVYKITPEGLTPLTKANGMSDDTAIALAVESAPSKHVILDRRSVDLVARRNPTEGSVAGKGYDRVQGLTKKVQTVYNPAYQPRNLIGDTIKAWQADTTGKSFVHAYKGLRAQRARNKFEKSDEAILGGGKKAAKANKHLNRQIRLKGGTSTYGKELALAERHGAIDTGQVAADIRAQLGGQVQDGKLWKINEARENWPRFATYLSARKQGMTADQAAKHSLRSHIDYNDLTPFERKYTRRAFQFYTFFARNTRDQARNLVERPGKAATVEKALEEASKFAGFDSYDTWVDQLEDYEQKGLPIPVKVGDHVYPVFVAPPQTDLNQLTDSGKEQVINLASRATFFKLVPELAMNYSVFFRGPVQNDKAPRVVAPAGVDKLPEPARNALGVRKILDKRSGKLVWGWYARADYVSRTMPQSNFGVSFLKPTADSRNLNGAVALASFLSGVKVSPDKRETTRINKAYDELEKVRNKLGELNQQGVYIDGRTVPREKQHLVREYKRLNEKKKQLERDVRAKRAARGDKVLPKAGAPKKRKAGWAGATSRGSSTPGGWGDTKKKEATGTPGGWGN